MKKRIFIVHGWDANPEKEWYPWLKKELETEGFEVCIPELPESENPRIYNWVPKLAESVGTPDENTYFVGHSLGCQTIARYLESLPEKIKIGGVVFVAGYFKELTGLEEDPETQETGRHWLGAPIDFNKVKPHLLKSVAIFSDNDPYVPLDNQDDFRDKLGSEIVVEQKKGHFSGDSSDITEFPVILESVLKIIR